MQSSSYKKAILRYTAKTSIVYHGFVLFIQMCGIVQCVSSGIWSVTGGIWAQ